MVNNMSYVVVLYHYIWWCPMSPTTYGMRETIPLHIVVCQGDPTRYCGSPPFSSLDDRKSPRPYSTATMGHEGTEPELAHGQPRR